jgi:hypothetical protein
MEDTTLNNTLSGTSPGIIQSKKTYDPKRRQVMLNILNQGTDPNELRRIHVLHGYDEDEVNDAIDTFKRISNPQEEQSQQEQGTSATDYANAIRNKQITLNDVPDSGKGMVVKELSTLGPAEDDATKKERQTEEKKQEMVPIIEEKIKQVDDLKDDWYLDAAVGPNALARASVLNWATGGKDEFINRVQQIIDQEALDKLIEVKGQGATFGSLERGEREMIQRSSTPIWGSVVREKDADGNENPEGKIIGYRMSEDDFKDELERIKQTSLRRRDNITKQKANEGVTSSGLKYIIE